MVSVKLFLIATALGEGGTGILLLLLPAAIIWALLGIRVPELAAIVAGRVAGAGLLAIGVACWLAHGDPGSRFRYSLLWGTFTYNIGAGSVLALTGVNNESVGVFLWPAVGLHAAMTIWSVLSIRSGSKQPLPGV